MRFFLLGADYIVEDGNPRVRLFGVDEAGRSVCVLDSYRPYLYAVPSKTSKSLEERVRRIPTVTDVETVSRKLGSEEVKAYKVYTKMPQDVPALREDLKKFKEIGHEGCYEYTINFYRRYIIDRGFSPAQWLDVEGTDIKKNWNFDKIITAKEIKVVGPGKAPKHKVLAFDLESYEEGGKSKIVMVSFWAEGLKKVITYKKDSFPSYVEQVKDEKELLERFVAVVTEQDPDIIVTYNGDEFDFPLLRERCDANGVKLVLSRDGEEVKFIRRMRVSAAHMNGRVHLDLYAFVNSILRYHMETESYSLGSVAAEVLKDEKIEFLYEQMLEAWRKGKDLAKFAEYNLKDSELTYRLAEIFVPQIFEIARVSNQTPFDASRSAYSQLVEWYLSRKATEMGYFIPNQPKFNEIEERRARSPYVGGFVKEPVGGIHDNVAVMDFRSLYPSVIATHNISPETANCKDCKPQKAPGTKHHFCEKKEGFYSAIIKGLIEERLRVKGLARKGNKELALEEKALKMIANASYGYLAYAGSKWYCYECAESAAAWGRYYIGSVLKEAERFGFTVLYADTDSCFVSAKNLEPMTREFLEKINKKLPGIIELELQGFYKRGLFVPKGAGYGTAKKRYALIDGKGNLTIRGLEVVRRDWCDLAKRMQREVLQLVLGKRDKEAAVQLIHKTVADLRAGRVPMKDLTLREQLTKPLEEYKQIGPHVVAARKTKERGRPYGPGMVVMYIITKGKGSISQRAEPIEDVKAEDVDVDYYINNQIVPAGMRVLQVFDIAEDELTGLAEKRTLKKFLKEKK